MVAEEYFLEVIISVIQLEIVEEELYDENNLLKADGFVLVEDKKCVTDILESTFTSEGHTNGSRADEVNKGGVGKTRSKRSIMFTLDKLPWTTWKSSAEEKKMRT